MKKILLLFVVLSFAYSFLLAVYQPRFVTAPTSQTQTNQIKVEEVAFSGTLCDTVLVGSSLLARFENPYFPDHFCNLAMGGESSATGLAVLERSRVVPKTLVIEVNILHEPDENLLSAVFSQPMYFLKKHVNLMRVYNQPVTLIYSKIRSYKSQFQFGESFNSAIYNSQLELQVTQYQKAHIDSNLLANLKKQALLFEGMGTKVIWLQMPVDPKIEATAYFTELADWSKQNGINLNRLDCPDLQTTDGLHLVPDTVRKCMPNFLALIR